MKPTLKQVLATAATLVLAGTGIGTALYQSGQTYDMACRQWRTATNKALARDNLHTAYVVIRNNAPIPKAVEIEGKDDRLLGDCANGWCEYDPHRCEMDPPARYPYECNLVDGIRLCAVHAPKYVLGGWKAVATSDPDFHFLDGCGDMLTRCLANLTGPQCRDLLEPLVQLQITGGTDECCGHDCDRSWCRHGLVYGPGMGGSCDEDTPANCPYAAILAGDVAVTGCSSFISYRGASEPERQAQETFTDEELEL